MATKCLGILMEIDLFRYFENFDTSAGIGKESGRKFGVYMKINKGTTQSV
jgi:hypothetical protein